MAQHRIPALSGLRAVAAYTVLFGHMIDANYLLEAPYHEFSNRLCYFGMSLFFVLSGFVIHFNYADKINSKEGLINFFVARFARLYPLYLFIMLFYVPLHLERTTPLVFVSHLTLTQSWVNTEQAFFAPTFSLSTEWFFYVVFAILSLVGVLRNKEALLARNAPMLIIMSVCILVGIFLLRQPSSGFDGLGVFANGEAGSSPWAWFTYYSPFIRIFEFFAGMLMSMAYRQGLTNIGAPMAILSVVWCVCIVFFGVPQGAIIGNLLPNFIYAPALAIVILYSCRSGNFLSWWLSLPFMVWAGEISYSIYLLQFICHGVVRMFIENKILEIVVTVAATTVVAFGSYLLIECPGRSLIRRQGGRFFLKARRDALMVPPGFLNPNDPSGKNRTDGTPHGSGPRSGADVAALC